MRNVFLNYAANHGKFYNAAANASLSYDSNVKNMVRENTVLQLNILVFTLVV